VGEEFVVGQRCTLIFLAVGVQLEASTGGTEGGNPFIFICDNPRDGDNRLSPLAQPSRAPRPGIGPAGLPLAGT